MDVFDPLSAIADFSARKALILVLAEHGVTAPISEITADTITQGENGSGKHVEVVWREGESLLASALGRFYPDTTSSGGSIHLDHLRPSSGEIQLKADEYIFSETEDGYLQLTVAA